MNASTQEAVGRVAAVVVSFNRKVLLAECINALLGQSHVPDKVFIIDNASTDDTGAYLTSMGLRADPRVHYVQLERNIGGAGGFSKGIDVAYQEGFDWIWIMDDDAEPAVDALEALVEARLSRPDVDAFANLKLDADRNIEEHHTGDITPCGKLMNFLDRSGSASVQGKSDAIVSVSHSSFVGVLISRAVVASVGLPRSEFFIHLDDLEYCTRIKDAGFRMLLVPGSVVVHKNAARAVGGGRGRVGDPVQMDRLWITYYGIRNAVWYKKTYCSTASALILALYLSAKFGLGIVLFRDNKLVRLRFRFASILDGLRGTFDNDKPKRLLERVK